MKERGEKNQKKKTKTILVVDDAPLMVELLSEMLQSAGFAVVSAMDGQKGWNEYKKAKPDLALIDIRMPGVSGLTLLNWIRKEDSSTPVILITGYDFNFTQIEAKKTGGDDFLPKPFRVSHLLDSIEKLLSQSPLELATNRLKNLVSLLAEENKSLKARIELLSKKRNMRTTSKEADKYRTICRAVTHGLKGEFFHIGNSIKNLQELVGTTPDIQEECDMIERSVEYSQLLLRRLLNYLDIGKPKLEPVDTLELLGKTERLARPRIPSSIKLEIIIEQSMKNKFVSANIEQLMWVLLELIQNAVNVLREKGGTIELKLEGRVDKIAISVKDDGPGIPRDLRKKLFKKQVRSESGLGLGLFLCNKVVRELGGRLELRSSRKRGTTSTILLPTTSSNKKEP